jgi:hypothetical protein
MEIGRMELAGRDAFQRDGLGSCIRNDPIQIGIDRTGVHDDVRKGREQILADLDLIVIGIEVSDRRAAKPGLEYEGVRAAVTENRDVAVTSV